MGKLADAVMRSLYGPKAEDDEQTPDEPMSEDKQPDKPESQDAQPNKSPAKKAPQKRKKPGFLKDFFPDEPEEPLDEPADQTESTKNDDDDEGDDFMATTNNKVTSNTTKAVDSNSVDFLMKKSHTTLACTLFLQALGHNPRQVGGENGEGTELSKPAKEALEKVAKIYGDELRAILGIEGDQDLEKHQEELALLNQQYEDLQAQLEEQNAVINGQVQEIEYLQRQLQQFNAPQPRPQGYTPVTQPVNPNYPTRQTLNQGSPVPKAGNCPTPPDGLAPRQTDVHQFQQKARQTSDSINWPDQPNPNPTPVYNRCEVMPCYCSPQGELFSWVQLGLSTPLIGSVAEFRYVDGDGNILDGTPSQAEKNDCARRYGFSF